MKIFIIILAAVLALILILLLFAGNYLCSYSMGVKRMSLPDARKWQEDHYDLSWYDPLEKTDYTVTSYDGYVLHAQFLKNPTETKKYIIITHGYTDNRFGSLKYTKMYLDHGYNVILYDLRAHGLNELTYVTYSVRESRDLDVMMTDSRKRYPDMEVLGLQGESLGSATSIAVLKYRKDMDFIVADCGFAEIIPVLKVGLRGLHLPTFFVYIAGIFAKLRYGLFYSEMRPIDSLPGNTVPILFMHGADDDFILPYHSEMMQAATEGCSELHLIPGAKHAESMIKAPEEYRRIVGAFLTKIGKE